MSYILDALRRADSERERGAVPTLHANQGPDLLPDEDDEGRRRNLPVLWWAVLALAVVVILLLAWQFVGRSPVAVETPLAQVDPSLSPPVATPPSPEPAAAPRSTPEPERGPGPAPAVPARATPQPEPSRPDTARAPSATRSAPPVAAAPSQAASAPQILTIDQLPENIRRELPSLTVSGAMYSGNAASRMLILNGQVFREGDKVTPELVLEQIRLKSAVLGYKGYHYSIYY